MSTGERLWRWHLDRVGAEEGFLVTAMRIGATALLAGNASLALSVAIAVRPQDAKQWIAWFEQHDIADSDAASDQLYGHLLGADPQYALQEFARFLECTSAIH